MNRVLVLLLAVLFLLSSCSPHAMRARRNNDRLMKLNIGDSIEYVREVVGKPHRHERYQVDGKEYEIWFYRTSHSADGLETDDEFTPVVFVDGELQGWSRNYYETRVRVLLQ